MRDHHRQRLRRALFACPQRRHRLRILRVADEVKTAQPFDRDNTAAFSIATAALSAARAWR
jgi:hypothetical protein